jgi:hypothetical protein
VPTKQGDLALLNDPVAQDLLASQALARVAYTWTDGTPRVVPVWFTWTGEELVLAGPADAPKTTALRANPQVAVTIDDVNQGGSPWRVLLVRGTATVTVVDGLVPEYAQSAHRYMGEEGGRAWLENVGKLGVAQMARIGIRPAWVGILDFRERFPSALERAMEAAQARAQS